MVKITDGKTPPATEAYREGWERIFGKNKQKIDKITIPQKVIRKEEDGSNL